MPRQGSAAGARSFLNQHMLLTERPAVKPLTSTNHLKAFVIMAVILVVAAGGLCLHTINRGSSLAQQETEQYLAELSQQTAYKINQRLGFNIQMLSVLEKQMAIASEDSERWQLANTVVKETPFEWIGFVDESGVATLPTQDSIDLSAYPVVSDALTGTAGVSEHLEQVIDEQEGALYAVPSSGIEGVRAVVGWIPPTTMQLLMNTDTADGVGFSHIVASDGRFILRSGNPNALLKDADNLFDSLNRLAKFNENDLTQMRFNMSQGTSGSLHYTVNGSEREMNYTPLDQGDWYAISIVPPQVYTSSLSDFVQTALIAVAGLAIVSFIVFGSYLLWVTNRKNREISRIAFVDSVTEGHTMARFDQLAQQRIKGGKPFTLISLDINNFRLLNDTFGKAKGDRLLKHVHDTIASRLREDEFVARIAADTFNVVLSDTDATAVAQRVQSMAEEFNAFNEGSDTPYLVKASCGAYTVDNAPSIVEVRDRANTARKSANVQTGRLCSISFFSDLEHDRLLREKEMENDMERALDEGEFQMYLQPKVCLATGKTEGAEALVRWNSPQRGLVPPDEFIPFFERNGFVIKIDLNVFEQACRLIRSWIDAGLEPMPISVNLSALHLRRPDFLDAFESIRQRYDVPPELLEFELTERVAFESLELLRGVVDDVHERGFRCSMDDFGSGYSSLNVLKEIPVDVLKIDREFFMNDSPRACHVVESVVELAKKLDMGTVAEGVETIPQVEFLRSVDCDMVQGYVFSTPVPVELFEKMVFGKTPGGKMASATGERSFG